MIFKIFSTNKKGGSGKFSDVALIPRKKLIAIISDEMKKYQHDDKNLGTVILKIFSLKQIANTHGFKQSDSFLASTMNNIKAILKDTDSIYRLNEDELVIILPGMMNEGHLVLAVNRIKQLFDNPVRIENIPISIRVTMGAALFPELSDDAEDLLLKSSIALAEGITKGLHYSIYPREEATLLQSNINVETQLRDAIEANALEVHYQPKVDIKTRTIVGVEALARWNHETHGLLPPNYFIAIAEKSNLINDFTNTILNTALKEAREWRGIGADISVSVNLSTINLLDDILIENIQRAINLWDISPNKIIFEITEGAMIVNPETSLLAMNNINAIGAKCSIDDFGTGYSSLSYLKKLPVAELKIDKSFICNMLNEEGDRLLVDSIINLAHNFQLHVVAEGVENEEIFKLLEQMNCDIAQGYHIAKPMPNPQFRQWLKDTTWIIKPL